MGAPVHGGGGAVRNCKLVEALLFRAMERVAGR